MSADLATLLAASVKREDVIWMHNVMTTQSLEQTRMRYNQARLGQKQTNSASYLSKLSYKIYIVYSNVIISFFRCEKTNFYHQKDQQISKDA